MDRMADERKICAENFKAVSCIVCEVKVHLNKKEKSANKL